MDEETCMKEMCIESMAHHALVWMFEHGITLTLSSDGAECDEEDHDDCEDCGRPFELNGMRTRHLLARAIIESQDKQAEIERLMSLEDAKLPAGIPPRQRGRPSKL